MLLGGRERHMAGPHSAHAGLSPAHCRAAPALWDRSLDAAEVLGNRTWRIIKESIRDLVSHPVAAFPCLLAMGLEQARRSLAHPWASSSHQQHQSASPVQQQDAASV